VTYSGLASGSQASISPNTWNNASGGESNAAVRVQYTLDGSNFALIQAGMLKHSSTADGDDCVDAGTLFVGWYVEDVPLVSQSFHCHTYSGTIANHLFAVKLTGSSYGGTTWQAYGDGATLGPTHDIGFSLGYALASGEYHFAIDAFDGTWGPSGSTYWRDCLHMPCSSYWTTIGSADAFWNEDPSSSSWYHNGSPPSPFHLDS
jgi:hypothetical protein